MIENQCSIIGCRERTYRKVAGSTSNTTLGQYFGTKVQFDHVDLDANELCDVCSFEFNPYSSASVLIGDSLGVSYTVNTSLNSSKLTTNFALLDLHQNDVNAQNDENIKYTYVYVLLCSCTRWYLVIILIII